MTQPEYFSLRVLGSGAGMVTFVDSFMDQSAEFSEEIDGDNEFSKEFVVDGKSVVLKVETNVGQEGYTTMRDLYINKGDGFVLLYKVTSKATFDEIRSFHASVLRVKEKNFFPMIIVGNDCHLERERQVSTQEGKDLAKELGCQFAECSAEKKINVEEAFFVLVREIRGYSKLLSLVEAREQPKKKGLFSLFNTPHGPPQTNPPSANPKPKRPVSLSASLAPPLVEGPSTKRNSSGSIRDSSGGTKDSSGGIKDFSGGIKVSSWGLKDSSGGIKVEVKSTNVAVATPNPKANPTPQLTLEASPSSQASFQSKKDEIEWLRMQIQKEKEQLQVKEKEKKRDSLASKGEPTPKTETKTPTKSDFSPPLLSVEKMEKPASSVEKSPDLGKEGTSYAAKSLGLEDQTPTLVSPARASVLTSSVLASIGLLSLQDQSTTLVTSPKSSAPSPSPPPTTLVLVEELLKKVQENERKLLSTERTFGRKTNEAKDEVSRQFQERLAEMKKENEEQSSQMQEELKRMKETINKTQDTKTKKEMEERLKKIEESHKELRKDFDEREETLREQQHIAKNESHLEFYRSIQNKLQQALLGCNVVATGMKSTSASSAAGKNIMMLGIAGGSVPLPANNLLVDLSTSTAGSGEMNLAAMRELDRLTEFVGRKLALMYEEQLHFIGAESAWLLGECAAKEMIGFLWINQLATPRADVGHVEAVSRQLIGAVSAVEGEEDSRRNKEKLIREKMKAVAFEWNFNTKILTSTNEEWSSDGIFHRAGILVEKDGGTKLWFSGGPTNPEKYGYRRGSEEEVKANLNLKQTRERVSTQVKESQLISGTSKAMKTHVDNAVATAQGNKDDVELLRKQMQMNQSQMERQAHELEKLTAMMASGKANAPPPTSSSLAKAWTSAEVASWLEKKGQGKLGSIAQEQDLDGMILFGLYSVRMDSATYRDDCANLGITIANLQVKLKGLLVDLFEGSH